MTSDSCAILEIITWTKKGGPTTYDVTHSKKEDASQQKFQHVMMITYANYSPSANHRTVSKQINGSHPLKLHGHLKVYIQLVTITTLKIYLIKFLQI